MLASKLGAMNSLKTLSLTAQFTLKIKNTLIFLSHMQ